MSIKSKKSKGVSLVELMIGLFIAFNINLFIIYTDLTKNILPS